MTVDTRYSGVGPWHSTSHVSDPGTGAFAARLANGRLTRFQTKKTTKMKKIIKVGLNAVAAFTLMFATTVSVVAQEKAVASEKVEVAGSVEAMVLASTLAKLNTAPVYNFNTPSATQPDAVSYKGFITTAWYVYTNPLTTEAEIKTASNYQRLDVGTPDCPDGAENVCAIELPNTGVHPNFNSTIQTALWTAQTGGTVASNIQMKE